MHRSHAERLLRLARHRLRADAVAVADEVDEVAGLLVTTIGVPTHKRTVVGSMAPLLCHR